MKTKSLRTDWHQADIIASLRKRGTTLAAVSRAAGLSSSTLANALSRSWPKGEKIIAEALDVNPAVNTHQTVISFIFLTSMSIQLYIQ